MFQNLRPFGNEGLFMCIRIFANQMGSWEKAQAVYTTGLIEGLMTDWFLNVLY